MLIIYELREWSIYKRNFLMIFHSLYSKKKPTIGKVYPLGYFRILIHLGARFLRCKNTHSGGTTRHRIYVPPPGPLGGGVTKLVVEEVNVFCQTTKVIHASLISQAKFHFNQDSRINIKYIIHIASALTKVH